jgi:ferric-chelate reductase [NAD(P)H]
MVLKALYKLGYNIYVVTSKVDNRINGQIANTVFQVTSEPPRVAISINKNNLTHDFIKESSVFSASVLCQDTPLTFIGRFGFRSGRDTDKFEGINYKIGETGAPIVLDNAVSYLETRVTKELDVGTHTISVGEVVNADVISDEVCMAYDYYHQIKGGKTPKAAATYLDEKMVAQVPKEEEKK